MDSRAPAQPSRLLGIAAIFCLGLAACSSAATPSPTAAPTGAPTAAPTAAPTEAPTPDDCGGYPTKDIELRIPYNPGGGFDTWARFVAPTLQTKLPNQVNVLPVNRPGAGGLVGVTEVLNSTPDGYAVAITEPGVLATQQIAGTTDADFSKLVAVGRLTVGPEVIVVSTNKPWQTIADVQAAADPAKPFLMASGGIAAINVVSFDVLGLPWTNVQHDSSAEALLSMIRGDTDITVYPLTTVQEGIAGGDLRPLVVVGTPPSAGQPGATEVAGVPTLDEVTGKTGLGAALAQTRMLVVAPGTPACVVNILSTGLADTFQDAAFLAQLKDKGYLPVYGTAEEAQAVIDVTFSTYQEYADLLKQYLG